MKTTGEEFFDDAIRKKLQNIQDEVPPDGWSKISRRVGGNKFLDFFSGLKGFLFEDLILLACFLFAGSILSSSHHIENEKTTVGNLQTEIQHPSSQEILKAVQKSNETGVNEKVILKKQAKLSRENKSDFKMNDNKNIGFAFGNRKPKKEANLLFSNIQNTAQLKLNNIQNTSEPDQQTTLADNKNSDVSEIKISEDYASGIEIENILPIAFLSFDLSNDDNGILFSNETNEKLPDYRLNPASFKIAAGPVYNTARIKSSALKEDKTSGKINRNALALYIDYPLTPKWKLTAGIEKVYSIIKYSTENFSAINNLHIDSISGHVVSPFDPPYPLTIYDSTITTDVITNEKDYDLTLNSFNILLMLEREIIQSSIDVSIGAGASYIIKNNVTANNADNETYSSLVKSSGGAGLLFSGEAKLRTAYIIEPFIRVQYEQSFNSIIKNDVTLKPSQFIGFAGFRIKL
jgi:hypothetical protein